MRITLINPFITSVERYGKDIGHIGGHQAPLGLCYLASFLEKNGVLVSLIDAEAEGLKNDRILERIRDFKPEAVGITSTTVAFSRARDLAIAIKASEPSIPIIIGGPHITANPRETLSFKCFDYGVMREGEITLFELLKAITRDDPLENIQGIVYRRNGEVVVSPPRPYIKELDYLPFPARHLLPDMKKYLPPLGSYSAKSVISMITSRGCPYECIFCDNNVFGRNIRYYSPEYVLSEIENVIDTYAAEEIFFLDDTFTSDRERISEILSLMRKKGIKIRWSCMTRVDRVDKDLLRQMKEAGCWQISIGVESGNQGVLDFIKKKIKLEDIKNVVNCSYELGIYVKGFFMIGHPTDTLETIDETINFAKANLFSDAVVTLSTPIPGTELYSIADRYGTFRHGDWSGSSYWKPVFIPAGLTKADLYKKQRQFYTEFYLRTNIILKHIRKIRNMSHLSKYAISIAKVIAGGIATSIYF